MHDVTERIDDIMQRICLIKFQLIYGEVEIDLQILKKSDKKMWHKFTLYLYCISRRSLQLISSILFVLTFAIFKLDHLYNNYFKFV